MQLPQQAETHNIVELVRHPKTGDTVISRLPEKLRVCLNDNAQERALNSSGCEIRFRLNSPKATIRIRACEVLSSHFGGGLAQILFGDFSQIYLPVTANVPVEYELNAPDYEALERASDAHTCFHPRLVRLLLPTHASICQIEIEGDIAAPAAGDIPSKRILNYGSSITHGSGALTSRETWAGRCAHILGYDLINLGFGGGCHCEPEITDYLCQRNDFDIAVLETGINMLGLDPDLSNERIETLIRRFSDSHKDKQVFCLGVFPCREDSTSNYQGRAQQIREFVKNVVNDIASPNLHFIEGRNLMTHSTGMTCDLTHPSPAGMVEIGTNLANEILKIKTT